MIYIIPNELRDKINKKLDEAIKKVPAAEKNREYLYNSLLTYYNEHGIVPDFDLKKAQA